MNRDGHLPPISGIIILDRTLHILELVQHGEHVDELAQGQQICLGDEIATFLRVAQAADLTAETLYGFPLKTKPVVSIKSIVRTIEQHGLPNGSV